ncbi:MAG: nitrogen regulation protein NR(I), partial [Alphaproteobacteria bacterium]|nr:nitrogen regulation protein NR(I) [Alphaproteobacteria bacterium]
LDSAAMKRLQSYKWPGNVRELENLVRRLAALYSHETIGIEVVEAELVEDLPAAVVQSDGEASYDGLAGLVEHHLRNYFDAHRNDLPAVGLYNRVLREVERPLIELTLTATSGNQIKAAQLLGLNRNTLRKKIRELDIQVIRGVKYSR